MSIASRPEIYFSFFMFTVDLKPEDPSYTEILIKHLRELSRIGYDGFDVHIAPRAASVDHSLEVESYRRLYDRVRESFHHAGLKAPKFATNVGTTQFFDPTSPYKEQRDRAFSYLKSRVDITAVLGGDAKESIMSGPFIYPYGVFPVTDLGEPLWSDALQAWMEPRYRAARPIIEELAEYAFEKNVTLAIEPVKNWETPPPNMVSEVLNFLDGVKKAPCGITIDTAQVLMESQGPAIFRENLARAVKNKQLSYIHISAPDRGAVHDSWIPWEAMLGEIEPVYRGPYLIEVFNAIPPLDSGMRMTRRRFWRKYEDPEGPEWLNAYHIADAALKELRKQIERFRTDPLEGPPDHGDSLRSFKKSILGTNTSDKRRAFLILSSELTGYSGLELEGTALVDSHQQLVSDVLGPQLTSEFYGLAEPIVNGPDADFRQQKIRDTFLPSKFWPVLSSLITLWYTGTWTQLPDSWYAAAGLPVPGPKDAGRTHTPSGLAYIEQLSYRAAEAHTPGAKPTGFGSWSVEPLH